MESRDQSGSLVGVLPVVKQRSWLIGNFATSVAFFNYGGALASDLDVARQMMVRASRSRRETGVPISRVPGHPGPPRRLGRAHR